MDTKYCAEHFPVSKTSIVSVALINWFLQHSHLYWLLRWNPAPEYNIYEYFTYALYQQRASSSSFLQENTIMFIYYGLQK